VYYVTPHYQDYDSVLARIDELTDAALRELLESGHEYIVAQAKSAGSKRRPRRGESFPRVRSRVPTYSAKAPFRGRVRRTRRVCPDHPASRESCERDLSGRTESLSTRPRRDR